VSILSRVKAYPTSWRCVSFWASETLARSGATPYASISKGIMSLAKLSDVILESLHKETSMTFADLCAACSKQRGYAVNPDIIYLILLNTPEVDCRLNIDTPAVFFLVKPASATMGA